MPHSQKPENLISAMIIGRDLALDVLSIHRAGRDIMDTAIVETVTRANVSASLSDANPSVAVRDRSLPPPESECRPISIGALGRVLEIPPETVRRRVHGLIDARLLQADAKGLQTRRPVLTSPEALRRLQKVEARAARAYRRLLDVGYCARSSGAQTEAGVDPDFLLSRLLVDYALDLLLDLRMAVGGYLDGLLLLELSRLSTAHLGDQRAWAMAATGQVLAPDGAKAPVSVSQLARAAHVNRETARRRLEALVGAGLCQRVRRRYLVPQAAVADHVDAYAQKNHVAMQRLLRALGKVGALQRWAQSAGPLD